MYWTVLLLHLFSLANCYVDPIMDFNDYTILSALPTTNEQIALLKKLKGNSFNLKLEFFNDVMLKKTLDFGIPSSKVREVQETLKSENLNSKILFADFQREIVKERKENPFQYRPHMKTGEFALNQYHRFEEIESYVKNLVKEFPDLVHTQLLGHTYQNREIFAVRIGQRNSNDKPIVYIDAGIHAREWVSSAAAVYIISQLVSNYNVDSAITELLSVYDWYIIPVLNPDGYVYTWTKNRIWRKNLARPAPYSGCLGVDPNRNFPIGFGGESTDDDPCTDEFMGLVPFSESESRAVKKFTESNARRIKAIFSLHSFGQLWMFPWAYSRNNTSDYSEMSHAANEAVDVLRLVHGVEYQVGPIHDVIYPAGGSSVDWQYNITRTPYVYGVELRDTGSSGFQLPQNQIVPTSEELWAAIQNVALRIQKNGNAVSREYEGSFYNKFIVYLMRLYKVLQSGNFI